MMVLCDILSVFCQIFDSRIVDMEDVRTHMEALFYSIIYHETNWIADTDLIIIYFLFTLCSIKILPI